MEEMKTIFRRISSRYPDIDANSAMPSAYSSEERRIAIELSNKATNISIPMYNLVTPVIELILTVPNCMWQEYGFPKSVLRKGRFKGADRDLLGREFAESATALVMFYGSLKIFDVLRGEYALLNNHLIWKRNGE